LGTSISDKIIFPLNYFAKRSFATKGVPKQELGNQKRGRPNGSPLLMGLGGRAGSLTPWPSPQTR
jgi:hypothetical protein